MCLGSFVLSPKMIKEIVLAALMLLLPTFTSGQYDFDEAYFYPEAMQSDLDMFVKVVKQVHPAPWRYISERDFDAMVVDARRQLVRSKSIYEYMTIVQPILTALGDAHTRMELPPEFANYVQHEEPLIPIKAFPEEDKLYLLEELKAFRTLPAEAEILSINDVPTHIILDRMRASISVDGENTSYADHRIAQDFPLIFHRSVMRAPVFNIQFKDSEGKEGTAELKALTGDEIIRAGKEMEQPASSAQWTVESTNAGKYVWLRIPTLSRTAIAEQGIRPDRIIKQTRKMLDEAQSKVLIIDLRGTSGMEVHLAETVFQLFALHPFRALSKVHFRGQEAPYGITPDSFPAEQLSELENRSVPEGEGFSINEKDELLKMISPQRDPFRGEVFIITDGGTVEAAVCMASMLRKDKRGLVIGAETGGNGSSFCASRSFSFTTSKTGLRFYVPVVNYELDRGSHPTSASGIKPDMPIYQGTRKKDEHDAGIERDLRMFLGEWEEE